MNREPNHVAVIGAGVGGLTCAALLAHAGRRVTVYEKNERVGGKLNWLEEGGYTWDMGPSLLTMPYVFEQLWQKLGRRLQDDLTLIPLPVTCRYRWTDGTTIDEDAAFWERPDVARFLDYARGLYDLSADAFLHHPLGEWWRQLRWRNLPKLRHLPKIASFLTMDRVVQRFFGHDPHLVQLFDRFATYNGSSPYKTPAAFNIIAYVEAKFGGWYVKGGLYEIARALERICREEGVEFRLNSEIAAVDRVDGGWKLSPENQIFAEVVCNQDVLSFTRDEPAMQTALQARDLAISGFVLYLGVARQYPQLSHHNIFFSDDYPGEFRQLFAEGRPADRTDDLCRGPFQGRPRPGPSRRRKLVRARQCPCPDPGSPRRLACHRRKLRRPHHRPPGNPFRLRRSARRDPGETAFHPGGFPDPLLGPRR